MTGGVESRIASSVVPSDLLAPGSLTDALFCVRHCVLQERVSGPAFRRPRHAVDGLRAATRVQTLPRSDLQKQATKLTPASLRKIKQQSPESSETSKQLVGDTRDMRSPEKYPRFLAGELASTAFLPQVCSHENKCACVYMLVCIERESARARKSESERARERERDIGAAAFFTAIKSPLCGLASPLIRGAPFARAMLGSPPLQMPIAQQSPNVLGARETLFMGQDNLPSLLVRVAAGWL